MSSKIVVKTEKIDVQNAYNIFVPDVAMHSSMNNQQSVWSLSIRTTFIGRLRCL